MAITDGSWVRGDTWALMSDVHGNLPALQRALEHARGEGATRLAFLGDALGGLDDEACCRLLMRCADVAVFGNRDLRVRLRVADDVQTWLRSLRATQTLNEALLCHSSPASPFPPEITAEEALTFRRGYSYWSLFPYVSGGTAALRAASALQGLGLAAAFHGHTHRQSIWRVETGVALRVRGRTEKLERGVTLVGVGSVGAGERGRVEYAMHYPAERAVRLVSLEP